MTGSTRYSNSYAAGLAAVLALGVLPACEETIERDPTTTSIRVTITEPADLGAIDDRLPDDAREVTVELEAITDTGERAADFDNTVDVQVHYLGTLTETGLTVQMSGGVGSASLSLPDVLGATFLWVEDVRDEDASFAAGTSDTLWFREPFLEDISLPDLTRPASWLQTSRFEGKQVRIEQSKHGADGRLVVTGVYAQGYTISDVNCAQAPCTTEPFNHLFIFTFGRPRDEHFDAIEIGHQVSWVSGGVGEFNGFTELNFPQTSLVQVGDDSAPPDESLLPEPVVIQASWLQSPQSATGMLKMEEIESGLAAVENGVMCELDDDYTTYKQWKLDLGQGCGPGINVISAGAVSDFDPATIIPGTVIPRVVGTIRAVNIGSFHVWILHPRRSSDITL